MFCVQKHKQFVTVWVKNTKIYDRTVLWKEHTVVTIIVYVQKTQTFLNISLYAQNIKNVYYYFLCAEHSES